MNPTEKGKILGRQLCTYFISSEINNSELKDVSASISFILAMNSFLFLMFCNIGFLSILIYK